MVIQICRHVGFRRRNQTGNEVCTSFVSVYFRFVLVSALRKKIPETKLAKDQKNTCETHTECRRDGLLLFVVVVILSPAAVGESVLI